MEPGSLRRRRIQTSKISGVSLAVLLKQANTKAPSGNPACARPIAPSAVFNLFGLVRPRAMTTADIAGLVDAFAESTSIVREAGFDAVRLPIRWSAHAAQTPPYAIDAAFLARVDWAANQALARGLAVDCGCFGTQAGPRTIQERLGDMRWDILRDLGLLLLAAQILAAGARGRDPQR